MGGFLKIRFAHWLFLKLASVLILGCTSTAPVKTISELRFRTIGNIPIIEGKINGKRAFFIIDTGASKSLLNESVSRHFGFKFTSGTQDHLVHGLGGSVSLRVAFGCRVEFGTLQIKNVQFCTRNMGEFVSVIQQHENISIAGIIGSDVFDLYKIAIDFKRNTISY